MNLRLTLLPKWLLRCSFSYTSPLIGLSFLLTSTTCIVTLGAGRSLASSLLNKIICPFVMRAFRVRSTGFNVVLSASPAPEPINVNENGLSANGLERRNLQVAIFIRSSLSVTWRFPSQERGGSQIGSDCIHQVDPWMREETDMRVTRSAQWALSSKTIVQD